MLKLFVLREKATTIIVCDHDASPGTFGWGDIHLRSGCYALDVSVWKMYKGFERFCEKQSKIWRKNGKWIFEGKIHWISQWISIQVYFDNNTCQDEKEEHATYDKILNGAKQNQIMTPRFQKLIHGFVLDNVDEMDLYRRYARFLVM